MELETLALAMKQNKMKMGDHYLAFDKRLGELEEEVFLPRATTLSRVLVWGEHFQEVLGKLKRIREYTIQFSKKDWERLEEMLLEYVSLDKGVISLFGNFVLDLCQIERRFQERLEKFLSFLDSSIRNAKDFLDDLERNGIEVARLFSETRSLSELNWLSLNRVTE